MKGTLGSLYLTGNSGLENARWANEEVTNLEILLKVQGNRPLFPAILRVFHQYPVLLSPVLVGN